MEEIFKARVFEYFEDDEKRFIICFKDLSGGPIISSDMIDEAKKKFEESLKVFVSLKNLMMAEEEQDIENIKRKWVNASKIKVEYHYLN